MTPGKNKWERIKKGPKRTNPLRFFAAVLTVILIAALFSLGVNFWVFKEVQKRLKIRVQGRYIPTVYAPSFRIEHGSFNWEDKVRLVDGNVEIGFDFSTLLSQQGIRIVAKSSGARIKFLGDWALQEGIEEAAVEMLYADVILGRRGIAGINQIQVKSPSFQFSLQNVEKKDQAGVQPERVTHA